MSSTFVETETHRRHRPQPSDRHHLRRDGDGGWVSSVHKGLALNKTYPLANHSDPTLAGCRSPCNATEADPARSAAHITGATCVGAGFPANADETQMLAWLQHGPLSVSIDASFGGYKSGVISGEGCNRTHVDHAVLLVGYGVDTSVRPWLPYWKIKNSWGPAFGEGGYVRVQAGVSCLGLRGACQARYRRRSAARNL